MTQHPILIIGGAGYIGSHMVSCLKHAGYSPVILDNLSTGHRHAVMDAEFILGDIHDTAFLNQVFSQYQFSAVMHFASYIQVGESVQDPGKYYHNNLAGTLNLLNVMRQWRIKHFIFSSTAAVYGEPRYTPIDEEHPIVPVNPYGRSKWMVEQILQDFAESYGLQYAVLRYFNAAGADPSGKLCESHDPETHLIPLVLQVANRQRDAMTIFGNDYPTPDGTCVRDYVHVADICDAHLLALQQLWDGVQRCTYNLGTEQGYSVRQVIDAARAVTGLDIPVVYGQRRSGDPAVLVADAGRALRQLGWQPRYASLQVIIEHAWRAMQNQAFISDALISSE